MDEMRRNKEKPNLVQGTLNTTGNVDHRENSYNDFLSMDPRVVDTFQAAASNEKCKQLKDNEIDILSMDPKDVDTFYSACYQQRDM